MKITEVARRAKEASHKLASLSSSEKNKIILAMAKSIDNHRAKILKANKKDVSLAVKNKLRQSMIERLILDDNRIDFMVSTLKTLAKSKDYIGEIASKQTLQSGLVLVERRCAFGVIAIIYESRPNVTVDVCGLSLKSSSAAILKGGSEAMNSNSAIVEALRKACPVKDAFQLITTSNRREIKSLLTQKDCIDLIIPRGSEGLISFVKENSRIPIIETGAGNCHIYVDESADVEDAIKIIINAKTQRPSVCNSVEKVLIHKKIARKILKKLSMALQDFGVEIRGCEKTRRIIECKKAGKTDWKTEYLDLIIAIKIVNNVHAAISHINRHSTKHSESILSSNKGNIRLFFDKVDSAVVYSNASTRFTDGQEFGLGAEIGISTQKLHARGPLGLKALTTSKFLVVGKGQIRQ